MSKRKPLSKTVRFEVFKRDRFTCQYCGAKAPDAVLHADHIHPVAEGGTNDILNLVTACAACNGGKGARLLDDRSAVERQRAQLEELQERREQLEMMLEWRDQAEREKLDTVEEVSARVGDRGGFLPNENGRATIRRWLKTYNVAEVLAALDESFDIYMKWDGDKPNEDAWNVAFHKVPAIASLKRQSVEKPYIGKLAYIQGILRRRLSDKRGHFVPALESAHVDWSVPLGVLEESAKRASTWEEFADLIGPHLKDKTNGSH